jgi:hypothetical protein
MCRTQHHGHRLAARPLWRSGYGGSKTQRVLRHLAHRAFELVALRIFSAGFSPYLRLPRAVGFGCLQRAVLLRPSRYGSEWVMFKERLAKRRL